MPLKNDCFDIFIAYHGDTITGTENNARILYEKINGAQIKNKKIRAFFKPISLPYGNFSETPRIASRTPLFLLLVNKNIPLNNFGQMAERNVSGDLKYLYQEIKAFRESKFFKKAEDGTAAKLLIVDDFNIDNANVLDPIFAGTPSFKGITNHTINEILEWIALYSCDSMDLEIAKTGFDWDQSRAETWHEMMAPSRPSFSELQIYRKYFKLVKQTKPFANKPKALILGSTVEFRVLASEEEFEITVVDYSKPYYDEISKELPKHYNINHENFIQCDWCDMLHNISSKYDVIIGDLSIGNVSPENLDLFFQNIKNLLNDDGYLLGKTIYKYSDYIVTAAEIDKTLNKMIEDDDINEYNIYSYIMYPLSIYACESYKGSKEIFKINFQNLYKVITQKVENISEEKRNKFSIYLNDTTKFDKKMPDKFFVYEYNYLLKILEQHNLFLEDIVYSKEIYKNDFPLLIIKNEKENLNKGITINSFLARISTHHLDIWNNSISSKYFLLNIEGVVTIEELCEYIIKLFNHAEIIIDNELNYSLAYISEKNMDEETKIITEKTEFSSEEKRKLQLNYTCGIVSNIINSYKMDASLLNLVLFTLFSNKEPRKIWDPHGSPWVSARICISLFPIYEQWKKKKINKHREAMYITKIEEVVNLLADEDINKNKLFWESETQNHFDTSALCIETLYLYNKRLQKESIRDKLNLILERYVRKNHIKETFIKYPIYSDLIDMVCNEEKINGSVAFKKMGGRIEWYTILYLICIDWGKNFSDEELIHMSKYIAEQLERFWMLFVEKSQIIIEKTIDIERSCVPQILYCLKRTGLFD